MKEDELNVNNIIDTAKMVMEYLNIGLPILVGVSKVTFLLLLVCYIYTGCADKKVHKFLNK